MSKPSENFLTLPPFHCEHLMIIPSGRGPIIYGVQQIGLQPMRPNALLVRYLDYRCSFRR